MKSNESSYDSIRYKMNNPRNATARNEDGTEKRTPSGDLVWVKPPVKCEANIEVALVLDPEISSEITFDERSLTVCLGGKPLIEEEVELMNISLQKAYGLIMPSGVFYKVLRAVARKNWPVNPLADYLNSVVWDGIPRLEEAFIKSTGCEDTEINRVLGRKWMIAAVARALEPGCKMDTMLIFYGAQGAGKSTWIETMAGDRDFYNDSPIDLDSKDALMGTQGIWIWEIAEMDSFRGRAASRIKSHLSSAHDRFRRPFGTLYERVPRSCLYVGSTNDEACLTADASGYRRFWIVRPGEFDFAWLKEHRDLLWAEAVDAFREMPEPKDRTREMHLWWLSPEEEAMMALVRDDHTQEDLPWVTEFVRLAGACLLTPGASLQGVALIAVFKQMAANSHGDLSRFTRQHQMAAADGLRKAGWTKVRAMINGVREVLWAPAGYERMDGIILDFEGLLQAAADKVTDVGRWQ